MSTVVAPGLTQVTGWLYSLDKYGGIQVSFIRSVPEIILRLVF